MANFQTASSITGVKFSFPSSSAIDWRSCRSGVGLRCKVSQRVSSYVAVPRGTSAWHKKELVEKNGGSTFQTMVLKTGFDRRSCGDEAGVSGRRRLPLVAKQMTRGMGMNGKEEWSCADSEWVRKCRSNRRKRQWALTVAAHGGPLIKTRLEAQEDKRLVDHRLLSRSRGSKRLTWQGGIGPRRGVIRNATKGYDEGMRSGHRRSCQRDAGMAMADLGLRYSRPRKGCAATGGGGGGNLIEGDKGRKEEVREGKEDDMLRSDDDDAIAVLIEIDGVLADVHDLGHRQAFNQAFSILGLECAKWNDKVYADLLIRCGGDEAAMVRLFFDSIGWPLSVATKDKEIFLKKVLMLKLSKLEEIAFNGNIPLRRDVEKFIDEAHASGVPVAIICAGNRSGEVVGKSVVKLLGEERLKKLVVVGEEEVKKSAYTQVAVSSGGISSPSSNAIAGYAQRAIIEEKQRVAMEVASILSVSVGIDTGGMGERGIAFGGGDARRGEAATVDSYVGALRAAVEIVGLPLNRCVLLVGSNSSLEAGLRVGIPTVAVKTKLTTRAEFPEALASYQGFGFGDGVTLSQLRSIMKRWRTTSV